MSTDEYLPPDVCDTTASDRAARDPEHRSPLAKAVRKRRPADAVIKATCHPVVSCKTSQGVFLEVARCPRNSSAKRASETTGT